MSKPDRTANAAALDNEPDVIGRFRGRMLAPQVCATELSTSEFTIHRWIRAGKIRAVKLSARCTRIDGDSLADYIAQNTFTPGVKGEQPAQLSAGRKSKPAGQA